MRLWIAHDSNYNGAPGANVLRGALFAALFVLFIVCASVLYCFSVDKWVTAHTRTWYNRTSMFGGLACATLAILAAYCMLRVGLLLGRRRASGKGLVWVLCTWWVLLAGTYAQPVNDWIRVKGWMALLPMSDWIAYSLDPPRCEGVVHPWSFRLTCLICNVGTSAILLAAVSCGALCILGNGSGGSQRLCHECGYDLHMNVSGRCPECGTPVGKNTLREASRQ